MPHSCYRPPNPMLFLWVLYPQEAAFCAVAARVGEARQGRSFSLDPSWYFEIHVTGIPINDDNTELMQNSRSLPSTVNQQKRLHMHSWFTTACWEKSGLLVFSSLARSPSLVKKCYSQLKWVWNLPPPPTVWHGPASIPQFLLSTNSKKVTSPSYLHPAYAYNFWKQ